MQQNSQFGLVRHGHHSHVNGNAWPGKSIKA
jgi:hypothetical protein